MKTRNHIPILICAIIFIWIGYCVGHHFALKAGEKRKAEIMYSNARIMLSVANNIKTKDYAGAISKLNGAIEFGLFYVEATKKDVASLSLIKSIVRPDIVIGNFVLGVNESLPDDNEIDNLKVELNEAEIAKSIDKKPINP